MDGRPISGSLVGRVAELPGPSERLIDLGHLLVADADPDPAPGRRNEMSQMRAARLLGEDADLWPELELIAPLLTEQWADTWLDATLALLAVDHPWYRLDDLAGGALHRRLDAIYDQFGTSYCAHEVQEYYWNLVESLIEASEHGGTTALKFAASFGLGAAGGWATACGFPVMPLATRGAEWISGQGKRPTTRTFEIANVALVWTLIPEGERGHSEAEEVMVKRCQEEFRQLTNRPDADPKVLRMWRSVLAMMGAELHEGVSMPYLGRKPLNDATAIAETLGLTVHAVDGFRRGDSARTPIVEANWEVVGQHPVAGGSIGEDFAVLAVVKRGERPFGPNMLAGIVGNRVGELRHE